MVDANVPTYELCARQRDLQNAYAFGKPNQSWILIKIIYKLEMCIYA